MQVGDRIEFNERAKDFSQAQRNRADVAHIAFEQAAYTLKTVRDELLEGMREIYPELEGWAFVVKHDEKAIVLLTRVGSKHNVL